MKHETDLPGIDNSFILMTIVEQDMQLLYLLRQFPNFARPRLQFLFIVEVVETLSRADTFLFPCFFIPAVKADESNIRGYLSDRRHTRLEALWLVDAHKGQVTAPEKIKGHSLILLA